MYVGQAEAWFAKAMSDGWSGDEAAQREVHGAFRDAMVERGRAEAGRVDASAMEQVRCSVRSLRYCPPPHYIYIPSICLSP